MAIGPKEKQRRALQAARAGNSVVAVKDEPSKVAQKPRTPPASPKAEVAGADAPEKPPLSAAAAGRQPGPVSTWLVKGSTSLLDRAERERAKRGLRSRNDAIVAVLNEGLVK